MNAFALQPDGCILIGGSFRVPDGGPMVGLARLRANGSLERSFFAGDGAGYGLVNSLAVLPHGQILAGGNFEGFNVQPYANLVRLSGNPGGIAPFVVRTIAGYRVHLAATPPPNVASYTVEDRLLPGPVEQITEGGVYDVATGRVRFGPFTGRQPRTMSYTIVVPPGDCLRPSTISGFVQADGFQLPTLGDIVVGLDGLFPADLGPRDGRVSRVEAESYAAAWRYGDSWPEGLHPIPTDFATRALTLGLGNDYELTRPDDLWQRQCTFGGTACFDGVNIAIIGGGTAHATCRLEARFEAQLGRVQMALEGVEQATYVIEAPSDLVRWEDVLIVPNVAGRMEFYDPAALSTGHRFYRARTTP